MDQAEDNFSRYHCVGMGKVVPPPFGLFVFRIRGCIRSSSLHRPASSPMPTNDILQCRRDSIPEGWNTVGQKVQSGFMDVFPKLFSPSVDAAPDMLSSLTDRPDGIDKIRSSLVGLVVNEFGQ